MITIYLFHPFGPDSWNYACIFRLMALGEIQRITLCMQVPYISVAHTYSISITDAPLPFGAVTSVITTWNTSYSTYYLPIFLSTTPHMCSYFQKENTRLSVFDQNTPVLQWVRLLWPLCINTCSAGPVLNLVAYRLSHSTLHLDIFLKKVWKGPCTADSHENVDCILYNVHNTHRSILSDALLKADYMQ